MMTETDNASTAADNQLQTSQSEVCVIRVSRPATTQQEFFNNNSYEPKHHRSEKY
jgi:hypothetical protein